jgi:hypothetical protein
VTGSSEQLSDLLDKAIDTSDSDAHKIELRCAIEHAAQSGGTLESRPNATQRNAALKR